MKYSRNPDKQEILEMQKNNLDRIAELHELGWNVTHIQEHFKGELSRSTIQHYVTVHKLIKRADGIVSDRCMALLRGSGLRFANCASNLKALEEEEFVKVLEFCADPANINLMGLSRDRLTSYVKEVISKKLYNKSYKMNDLHDRVRDYIALKYLIDKQIPASTEVVLSRKVKSLYNQEQQTGNRIDVWGYDRKDCFGIEVKTNIDDFEKGKEKIKEYNKYSNYFYILTTDEDVFSEAINYFDETIGVLYYDLVCGRFMPEKSRASVRKNIEVNEEVIEEIKFNLYLKEVLKNVKY